MKPKMQIAILIMLLFINSACGLQQNANAEVAAEPTSPPVVPAVTATPPPEATPVTDISVADHAPDEDAALIWEGISLADWIIERTDITIDGEPAVVLDHLPGQDLNRRVFLVHEGRFYHLFFTPVDPSQPEVYQRMEDFYRTIIDSFRFVSPQ
jgi:hypothetical protein